MSGTDVTVDISTNFECGGLLGALVYDAENLTYEAAIINDNVKEYNEVKSSILDSDGKTRLALVGDVANGTDGNWLTITYTAKNGADVDFIAKSFKVYDVKSKLVDANVEITKEVINVLRGDANEDGALDIRDLVEMYNCKDSANISGLKMMCLDFNEDGTWDFDTDMPAFRKYLLNA